MSLCQYYVHKIIFMSVFCRFVLGDSRILDFVHIVHEFS
jgi:hypothetical protein